jgi:hypothetical protein
MTFPELLSEALVVAACMAAAIGCFVLSRRIRHLASTERGIGKAVSEMSRSVGQFETLLVAAEASAREASAILDEQLVEARRLVARLEMLAGAAPRAAASARMSAPSADPLAEVVPKGAAGAASAVQAATAKANGSAQMRLANLAQRRAASPEVAAVPGRGARG